MVLCGDGGVSIGTRRRKALLLVFLVLLGLAAGLWCEGEREYRGFSPRTARRIVAQAGLEKALSLSVIGDRTGWQRMPPHSDLGLVDEALALLRDGEEKKMRWFDAPTPEEIWIFALADGREVLVGWWNADERKTPTITGDVYGDFPADGDRLIKVSREGFWKIQQQLLGMRLRTGER